MNCKLGNVYWITNISEPSNYYPLNLDKTYNDVDYPKYDDYDAINVNEVQKIPTDYREVMGVPISFLDKCNPEKYEIIGIDRYVEDNPYPGQRFTVKGKPIFARLLVRVKQETSTKKKAIKEKVRQCILDD